MLKCIINMSLLRGLISGLNKGNPLPVGKRFMWQSFVACREMIKDSLPYNDPSLTYSHHHMTKILNREFLFETSQKKMHCALMKVRLAGRVAWQLRQLSYPKNIISPWKRHKLPLIITFLAPIPVRPICFMYHLFPWFSLLLKITWPDSFTLSVPILFPYMW